MFVLTSAVWLLAICVCIVNAASQVPVNLFADNKCKVASPTSPNITVTLDSCIVTIGLQSLSFEAIPCAGGSSSTVEYYAFDDQRCVTKKYLTSQSLWNRCWGPLTAGEAVGSILLSCNTSPRPDGTFSTVTVAPVATGALPLATPGSGSSSSNSGSSSSSGGSSSSTSNDNCSGFSCLPFAARISIIISLSVALPTITCGGWRCYERKKRRDRLANIEAAHHGMPQQAASFPQPPLGQSQFEQPWQKPPTANAVPLQTMQNMHSNLSTSLPPNAISPINTPLNDTPPNAIQPMDDYKPYHPPPKYTY